jgi:xylulokinase
MEGAVYSLRQGLDLIQQTGITVDTLTATGGATRHPLWLQILSDVFELPIQVSTVKESAAIGAAWLGAIGTGTFSRADYEMWLKSDQGLIRVEPDPKNTGLYRNLYPIFRQMYPALNRDLELEG